MQDYVHNDVLNTSLGANKSNVGGWQSPILWSELKELKELQTFVEKEIPEYTFQSLWFNRNGYGHYNLMHNHHTETDGVSECTIEVPDKIWVEYILKQMRSMTLKRIDYYCFLLTSDMEYERIKVIRKE